MKNFDSRLKKVEDVLTPKTRYCLAFARHSSYDEDFGRQKAEFEKTHGDNAVFFVLTSYCDENKTYEEFLMRERRSCGGGNCFAWWPPLPPIEEREETPIPSIPEKTNDNANILRILKGE